MTVQSKLAADVLSHMSTPLMAKERAALAEEEKAVSLRLSSSQGDTVSISEEAKALSLLDSVEESQETGNDAAVSRSEKMIREIKEKIDKLQEEIAEIERSNLPSKKKESLVQEKQAELMELSNQLRKLLSGGQEYYGGTRAEGFGNSASSF